MHALLAQNAGTFLPGSPRTITKAADRSELEAMKRELEAAQGTSGTMVYWIEKVA